MQLTMPYELGRPYKGPTQQVRVISEHWAERNLYCVNCSSGNLRAAPVNTRAIDFVCPACDCPFQLKSRSQKLGNRLVDAAYSAMHEAIVAGSAPNLFALHYDRAHWCVVGLTLIPSFAFTLSLLERRPPLGPGSRRRGWVGCNILLANVPEDARISVVRNGLPCSPSTVRAQYARLRPLASTDHEARGWTLDVLKLVRSLGSKRFSLRDLYGRREELRRLHPRNQNVDAKVRQQLQRLRDLGFVEFQSPGEYELVTP